MTPRVLAMEFEAARERAIDRFKEGLTDAWNNARTYALVRSKKGLPALSKLLEEVGGKKAQTAGDMKATVEYLSRLTGISMRRGGKTVSG